MKRDRIKNVFTSVHKTTNRWGRTESQCAGRQHTDISGLIDIFLCLSSKRWSLRKIRAHFRNWMFFLSPAQQCQSKFKLLIIIIEKTSCTDGTDRNYSLHTSSRVLMTIRMREHQISKLNWIFSYSQTDAIMPASWHQKFWALYDTETCYLDDIWNVQ